MNRIFALLSYNSESCEKQLQLAGYVLSNLAKDEKNLEKLRVFEKKLAIISFNDDSVSSITTTLLCRLTQPERYKIQEEK
jgi:Trk K+ transport system NAD-binding subunit